MDNVSGVRRVRPSEDLLGGRRAAWTLDRLSIGYAEFNLAGRLTYANQAALELWQRTLPGVLNQTALDLFPGWDFSASGRVQYFLDSTQRWVEARFSYCEKALSVLFEDVTERHGENGRQLCESESRFRALLDSTAEGIFGLDLQGNCTFANASCIAMLGFNHDREMLGRHARELISSREDPAILQALSQDHPIYLPHTLLGRADGEAIPVECWAHPTRVNGGVVGCVVTFLDITHRLESDQQLAYAKSAADASSRAKSDFLANISHEIRTPMAAIIGYVDVLLRRVQHPDDISSLQIIQRNGIHLLEIINDILDLSKIEAGNFEVEALPVSVRSIVTEVVSLMKIRAQEKELELRVSFVSPIPEVISSDPTRLRQILLNLLGNAIKFTLRGWVALTISLKAAEERICFRLEDTGIGIAPGRLEHLFDPFSQADASVTRRFGGTGLGLAISRRLVKTLGGELDITSREGIGTVLGFSVSTGPLSQVDLLEPGDWVEVASTSSAIGPALPRLDGLNVLLVDDCRDLRLLMQSYLEEAGALVASAADGQMALDYLAENETHVVVLDMQMPRLDGYSTAREIRRCGLHIPILAVTASAMKGDRESCLQSGCNTYLTKPVERVIFIHQVANLGQRGVSLRVLVVEDNPMAAMAVKAMLHSAGCEIDVAHNGEAALALVEANPWPDFILIDLGLPDIDGWELLARLKTLPKLSQTRFIAHTGLDPREVVQAAREVRFDAVIQKPATREVLLKMLLCKP